jgi:phage terminase Nu1 subunit (DNA packaging protein)
MNTTMSKTEIAELFGVSTRTITNWQTLGWLVRSGHKYDSAASVRSVTKALQAAVQGR